MNATFFVLLKFCRYTLYFERATKIVQKNDNAIFQSNGLSSKSSLFSCKCNLTWKTKHDPTSLQFEETIEFDVNASFARRPLSRLIKPGDITKEC